MRRIIITSERKHGTPKNAQPSFLYRRAALRDTPAEKSGDGTSFVNYEEAHDYKYHMMSFGSTIGMSRARTGHAPDTIRVGITAYQLEPNAKSHPAVRVMSDGDVAELDALEAEAERVRLDFQRRIADLREAIYARSRKLRVDEIINHKAPEGEED